MKKNLSILIVVIMVITIAVPSFALAKKNDDISIIFSGDMHSHLEDSKGKGGFARIMSQTKEIKEEYPDTFMVDGGDFSMGTPMQTIFKTDAAELKMMARVGYDVTTLGNHEFDYGSKGLAQMLNSSQSYSSADTKLPEIVSANIDWDKTLADKNLAKDGKKLKRAFNNYGIDDYTIVEKNGVKIAVFGLLGPEAISNAPNSGVIWKDYIKRAKAIVSEIKRNGEADLVMCLSHSGINEEDQGASEDVALAKEVPDIDVIVSAHSHTELKQPIKEGKTLIVASGEYTNNLGHLVVTKSGEGYKVKVHRLIALDSGVSKDSAISQQVSYNKQTVNNKFFSKYGYNYDQVLARSSFDIGDSKTFGKEQGEEPIANLISDSYKKAASRADGDKHSVDVAIVPSGTVRGTISKGEITTKDAFEVSSLGMGKDGTPGYPLVSVYLTGKELKSVAEIDASISPMMTEARLYTSGLKYKINSHRLIMNRAFDIKLMDSKGEETKIKNSQLYRVVGGLYSCQMLGAVTEKSHGLISIVPKDKSGKEIKDFNEQILYKNGTEVKEWEAVADYINGFAGGKVPAKYKDVEGRKIVDDSFNPLKIFSQPNNVAFMLIALLMIPVVIIAGIIYYIIKRRHSRRGYGRSMFKTSRISKRFPARSGYRRSNNKRPGVKNRNFSMKKKRRKF